MWDCSGEAEIQDEKAGFQGPAGTPLGMVPTPGCPTNSKEGQGGHLPRKSKVIKNLISGVQIKCLNVGEMTLGNSILIGKRGELSIFC